MSTVVTNADPLKKSLVWHESGWTTIPHSAYKLCVVIPPSIRSSCFPWDNLKNCGSGRFVRPLTQKEATNEETEILCRFVCRYATRYSVVLTELHIAGGRKHDFHQLRRWKQFNQPTRGQHHISQFQRWDFWHQPESWQHDVPQLQHRRIRHQPTHRHDDIPQLFQRGQWHQPAGGQHDLSQFQQWQGCDKP